MLVCNTKIGGGGRIVIPIEYREKLGVKEGDTVTITIDDMGLHISTAKLAIEKMQKLAQKIIPPNISLSKELIKDRRKQAINEL